MKLGKLMSAVFSGKGSVSIDGRDFVGRSVVINGDKVIVDGVEQGGQLCGPVSVTIHGNVESLDGPIAEVNITGSVGRVKTMSGNIRCGDVTGDVGTMSGDVTAQSIGGSVKTMSGDIRLK